MAAFEFIPLSFWYDAPLTSQDRGRRHDPWLGRGARPHSKVSEQLAIDLQKMNWKFRAGFPEHTGVSLKEHSPNNPRGEYTRVHQDTAQSRHRQRPPQPSAACLSA